VQRGFEDARPGGPCSSWSHRTGATRRLSSDNCRTTGQDCSWDGSTRNTSGALAIG
jgi:hypothetical protein